MEDTQPQNTEPSASQPAEPTIESLSGVVEGTVLTSGEVVRGTYDEDGNLIGWHKEPATEGEV